MSSVLAGVAGGALRAGRRGRMMTRMPRPWASEVDLEEAEWRLEADGELRRVDAGEVGYAPASVGDLWVYATRQGEGAASETRERVLTAGWAGEAWVARVRSEHPGNPAADSERSLIATAAGVSPDIGAMETAIGPVRVLATHGVFLPRVLTPGLRWTWGQRLQTPLATMRVEGAAAVVGEVVVTVPAGRFVAMLVRGESSSRVEMLAPGGAPPIEHRQRDESFHVRGLGLVRHRTLAAQGHELVKELVAHGVHGAPRG